MIRVINIGCPPSINFLSEVFLVGSLLFVSFSYVSVLALMCFVTAAYCLFLYCSVNHGGLIDLSRSVRMGRERSLIAVFLCGGSLFVLCIVLDLRFV